MTSRDIAWQRLVNQQIVNPAFGDPVELLRWMGCIQAQDYAGAKWAIGCRLKTIPGPSTADKTRIDKKGTDKKGTDKKGTDAGIEVLFDEGKILRTHILRPTWHFVLPEDIHWMLKLTAPKIKTLCKPYHQKLGIDSAFLKRSKSVMSRALDKKGKMTREELSAALEKEKLNTADGRIGFLLMDAEVEGLICSGGRIGKQFGYALLKGSDPKAKSLSMEEAAALLAKRYFTSRGPATLADFSWWSGLNNKEAREAIEINGKHFQQTTIDGNKYWSSGSGSKTDPGNSPGLSVVKPSSPGPAGKSLCLLPPFDEYAVSYKDRKDLLRPELLSMAGSGLKPIIVSGGRVIGTWHRTVTKDKVSIETALPEKAAKSQGKGAKTYGKTTESNDKTTKLPAIPSAKVFQQAYKRYSEFIGKKLQPVDKGV